MDELVYHTTWLVTVIHGLVLLPRAHMVLALLYFLPPAIPLRPFGCGLTAAGCGTWKGMAAKRQAAW